MNTLAPPGPIDSVPQACSAKDGGDHTKHARHLCSGSWAFCQESNISFLLRPLAPTGNFRTKRLDFDTEGPVTQTFHRHRQSRLKPSPPPPSPPPPPLYSSRRFNSAQKCFGKSNESIWALPHPFVFKDKRIVVWVSLATTRLILKAKPLAMARYGVIKLA
ncbi:hypothetical protein BaRGS_00024501 [Batillaria attramentaria]|uniref:Uncharacterized protein n=1 Tax=Batillaria attramentaria TaxID=370345 RepID=A0ABD0KB09_9CAEN